MHKMKNIEKIIALITIPFVLGACQTIDRIKGNKPSCPSYNYSNFMGKTKEYLLAAKIKDEYVIIENGQNLDARNDLRVAFYTENNLISGIGCY